MTESARFTLYHRGQKNLLGHLLVSQSLLSCYKTTESFDRKFPASDHVPIVARVRVVGFIGYTGFSRLLGLTLVGA